MKEVLNIRARSPRAESWAIRSLERCVNSCAAVTANIAYEDATTKVAAPMSILRSHIESWKCSMPKKAASPIASSLATDRK